MWPDPRDRIWPRETDETQLAMTYTTTLLHKMAVTKGGGIGAAGAAMAAPLFSIKWPLLKYLYNLYPWHPMKSVVPHSFLYSEQCMTLLSGISGVARTQPMPGHSVGTLRLPVSSLVPGPR